MRQTRLRGYGEGVAVCVCLGLDPTEPYFQGTGAAVSLDPTDAPFVDVIHTDGLPFNSKLGIHHGCYQGQHVGNSRSGPPFLLSTQVWGRHSLWDTWTFTLMEES